MGLLQPSTQPASPPPPDEEGWLATLQEWSSLSANVPSETCRNAVEQPKSPLTAVEVEWRRRGGQLAMLRRILTILSLVGLVASLGLWGVSYLRYEGAVGLGGGVVRGTHKVVLEACRMSWHHLATRQSEHWPPSGVFSSGRLLCQAERSDSWYPVIWGNDLWQWNLSTPLIYPAFVFSASCWTLVADPLIARRRRRKRGL